MTGQRGALVAAFGAMCVCGFLLTPAGLETRSLDSLKSIWLAPVIYAATVLNLAALVMVFGRPQLAAVLGIIAAILYVFIAPLDHLGVFYAGKKGLIPRAISRIEIAVLVPSVLVLLLAPLVRRDAGRLHQPRA